MLQDADLVSVQEVRSKVEAAHEAWQIYRGYSQERVDAIVEAMGARARAHARRLAEMAVQETRMGNVEDKIAKNLLNADLLVRTIRGMKTVGVLREVPELKVTEIGVPVGVVAAILPTTNPTSTAIYKAVVSLKAGNAVVMAPHPRAHGCTCATISLLMDAAREAGAPEGVIQCINNPTMEGTTALMKHPKTGVILSTGGAGIVKAAYSSGKPAFGVGPGNVPVLIDSSYDVGEAVAKVVDGKSFDYGTVCSSEQTVVAERGLREKILAELKARGAFLMNDQQRQAVEKALFKYGTTVSAECVGQSPQRIAEMAGFSVPASTRILVAEIGGVGKAHPLSAEKLSPVLALLFTDSFDASCTVCEQILHFGGLGHTCVIFAKDEAKVRQYGLRMPAFRILVNTSSPQGSTGITTGVQPAMTLGCGAMAGNITSDNVGPQHLINIKRIAWAVRTPAEAFPDAPPAQAGAAIDKMALVAAVERYLTQKGVAVTGASVAEAVAAALPRVTPNAPKPAGAPVRPTIEGVVDRFLATRRAAAAPAAPSCGCPLPVAAPSFASAAGAALASAGKPSAPAPTAAGKPSAPAPTAADKPAAVPAPVIEIVDFVCEADVREAINRNKKIYVGPRTIITPAARELAGRDEILVLAQR